MKEEHEMDSFFDSIVDEKNLINAAKRKSYFRITAVSFFVSMCVLILLILLKIQLTPYFMTQKMIEQELYYEIYGANIYTGAWTEQYKLVNSSAVAPKYKLLNGRPVNLGEISFDSSPVEITIGNSEFAQFTYSGNRVMNFFHPFLQYTKYENALNELNNVNDGKWIELGLSFDQPYSYEEVVSMLPKDVTLQWNWVNTFSEEEIKAFNSEHKEYTDAILKEHVVAGFPSIAKDGETIKEPVSSFITTLDLARSKGGSYEEEYEYIYNTLKNNQDSLTNENIEIIGVVVVGDKQQLKSLIDQHYIKASSFGAIIDKY